MSAHSLTAIIISSPDWFNAEDKITKCLESVSWADSRIILTSKITTRFEKFAKQHNAKLHLQKGHTFAQWRNYAAQLATTDWIFYIDTDEQVTPQLRREIRFLISQPVTNSGYAIPRTNIILGKPLKHGGWWPDYVLRLIYKPDLIEWHGDLHEQPQLSGSVGYLKHPLLHHKHDNLEEMLDKTINWSKTEAKLMYQANHPPMNPRRFIRPFLTEIFSRFIFKRGFLDGPQGLIDAMYQGFSKFISYLQLWEMQQKNSTNTESASGIIWDPSKTKHT